MKISVSSAQAAQGEKAASNRQLKITELEEALEAKKLPLPSSASPVRASFKSKKGEDLTLVINDTHSCHATRQGTDTDRKTFDRG